MMPNGAASRPIAENVGAARAARAESPHQPTRPRTVEASRDRALPSQAANVPSNAHVKLLAEYQAIASKSTVETLKIATADMAVVVEPSSRRARAPSIIRVSKNGKK